VACSRVSRHALGLVALCAWLGLPATSAAHFVLVSPASTFEQNALGDPQKAPPCGDQGNAVATGEVTALQAGDTITVTIDETIFHPGHYRIALALDDGIFPEEPPVTPGTTDCGSAPIDPAPAFPVLADGVWEHTSPFGEPQSIEITIPEGVSCQSCTLQVIQFMSNHGLNDPGGCYYHHCATLSVEPSAAETGTPADESGGDPTDGGPATTTADGTGGEGGNPATGNGGSGDAGDVGNGDASATGAIETDDAGQAPASDEGCSCSVPTRGGMRGHAGTLLGVLGLAALRLRRRRS
jgi:MYXO-CTERM domain-containing protein